MVRGSSRNHTAQTSTQTALSAPSIRKAPRHPTMPMSQATNGGVSVVPMETKLCVSPCTKLRRVGGVQSAMTRVMAGNGAASPSPSTARAAISPPRLDDRPQAMVAPDQIVPKTASPRRAPHLSHSQPTGACRR